MSKKATKTDEFIEALCDERVLSKIFDKITSEVNSKLDLKFNELMVEMNEKLNDKINEMNEKIKISIEKITDEKISQSINPVMNELSSMEERIDTLEAMSVQNDLIIIGLRSKIKDKEADPARNQPQTETNKDLLDLVLNHLINDLEIKILPQEISHVFRLNKKSKDENRSSIVVNFISSSKKFEVIRKAKYLRKNANPFPTIFHNERLTKKNSDLFFKSRTLQKLKKIQATWIYKGEIYIRKESASKAIKITQYKDLNNYE